MGRKKGISRLGLKTVTARRARINRLKESPIQAEFRRRENAKRRKAQREAAKKVGELNLQLQEKLGAQDVCQATLSTSKSLFRKQRLLNRQAKQQASSITRQAPEQLLTKRTACTNMKVTISNNVLENPRSLSWSTLRKLFASVKCPKSYHICTIGTHLVKE